MPTPLLLTLVLALALALTLALAAFVRPTEPFAASLVHTSSVGTTTDTRFVVPVGTALVAATPSRTRLYCDRFDVSRNTLATTLAIGDDPVLPDVDLRDWVVAEHVHQVRSPFLCVVPQWQVVAVQKAFPAVRFVACLDDESVVVLVRATVPTRTWSDVRQASSRPVFGYVSGICGAALWEEWMREEGEAGHAVRTRAYGSYAALVAAWRAAAIDGVYFYGGHPSPFLAQFSASFEVRPVDLAPLFAPDDTVGVELQMAYPHWVRVSVPLYRCARGRGSGSGGHADHECIDYQFNTDALVYRTYGFRRLLLAVDVPEAVVAQAVARLEQAAPRLGVARDKLGVCPYDLREARGAERKS